MLRKMQELQRCAEKLQIQEKLAKAEARLKFLEGIEKYQAEGKNQENDYTELIVIYCITH